MTVQASTLEGAATAVEAMRMALAGRFMLAGDQVVALRRQHGHSEAQLLTALIPAAAALARPPISRFHVGCAEALQLTTATSLLLRSFDPHICV